MRLNLLKDGGLRESGQGRAGRPRRRDGPVDEGRQRGLVELRVGPSERPVLPRLGGLDVPPRIESASRRGRGRAAHGPASGASQGVGRGRTPEMARKRTLARTSSDMAGTWASTRGRKASESSMSGRMTVSVRGRSGPLLAISRGRAELASSRGDCHFARTGTRAVVARRLEHVIARGCACGRQGHRQS